MRVDQFTYTAELLHKHVGCLWDVAPGTDSRYEVSSEGEVRNARTGRVLRTPPDRAGYRRFTFTRPGLPDKTLKVHRLVAEAFIGPPPFEGALVRHLDGNPGNNRVDNLAWGTVQDNSDDAVRHGSFDFGARHHKAKLTAELVVWARREAARGVSYAAIGRALGVSSNSARLAVLGLSWRGAA